MRFISSLIGILIVGLALIILFKVFAFVLTIIVFPVIAIILGSLLLSIPAILLLIIAAALLLVGSGGTAAVIAALIGLILLSFAIPFSWPFWVAVIVIVLVLRNRDKNLLQDSKS